LGHQRGKKVPGMIEHKGKQFQKNVVPGKNTAVDESRVGFKHKIIFKMCSPKKKPMKWVIRLFLLADSHFVHSIVPNYVKVKGDVCNLPYSEKPFISRIVLSLMDRV
jgi:hypothetical protein